MKYLFCLLALIALACSSSAAVGKPAPAPVLQDRYNKGVRLYPAHERSAPAQVRQLCGNANLRGSPSANGPAYGVKYTSSTVRVYEERGGWVRVSMTPDRWITGAVLCK